MNLFWEYTQTHRFHWVDDGKCWRLKKFGMMYEHKRWAIVNCTARNLYNQSGKVGYDLWHKGKNIKHGKTVKELKKYVKEYEKKYDNMIFDSFGLMMDFEL